MWAEAKVFYRDTRGTHKPTINKGAWGFVSASRYWCRKCWKNTEKQAFYLISYDFRWRLASAASTIALNLQYSFDTMRHGVDQLVEHGLGDVVPDIVDVLQGAHLQTPYFIFLSGKLWCNLTDFQRVEVGEVTGPFRYPWTFSFWDPFEIFLVLSRFMGHYLVGRSTEWF